MSMNSGPQSYEFTVQGMMCDQVCPALIKTALGNKAKYPFITGVATGFYNDEDGGWATVTVSDSRITANDIKDIINGIRKGDPFVATVKAPESTAKARYGY